MLDPPVLRTLSIVDKSLEKKRKSERKREGKEEKVWEKEGNSRKNGVKECYRSVERGSCFLSEIYDSGSVCG